MCGGGHIIFSFQHIFFLLQVTSFSPSNLAFSFSCDVFSLYKVFFLLSYKLSLFFFNFFLIFSLNNHEWSISYKLTFTLFIASFHSLYFSIFLFHLFQHSQMFFFLASSICITSFLSLTFFFYFFQVFLSPIHLFLKILS